MHTPSLTTLQVNLTLFQITCELVWYFDISLANTLSVLKISISLSSRVAYYGVFDGHAGPRAATYAAENLHETIKTKLPKGILQYLVSYPNPFLIMFHRRCSEFGSRGKKVSH